MIPLQGRNDRRVLRLSSGGKYHYALTLFRECSIRVIGVVTRDCVALSRKIAGIEPVQKVEGS